MKSRKIGWFCALSLLSAACSRTSPPAPSASSSAEPAAAKAPVTLTVIGTSDLHGHVEKLPLLGGYLAIVREVREKDGGGVILVDAGDMFQGTLESNLGEGDAVVAAYNTLRYDAAAIGNHEFDFGPKGPAATVRNEGDDPRGALKARAAEARFPFLSANVIDKATGAQVGWPNMPASTLVEAAGTKVGIIGVTTTSTPSTTLSLNVKDLDFKPLAAIIASEAKALRARGARVIVVAAHAGGRCKDLQHENNLASCEDDQEIFQVARALPKGTADVIVGGHTHAGVAHVVSGIPIIESFSYGRAFGRVDLTLSAEGEVTRSHVFPPQDLCKSKDPPCVSAPYEGRTVTPSAEVDKAIQPAIERARELKNRKLGPTLDGAVTRSYDEESPLGNLLADLILRTVDSADVALMNGGGLRADLPKGELTYGSLYEAFPFDNQVTTLRLSGADLTSVLVDNLEASHGFLSVAGVRAKARCKGASLTLDLTRQDGRPVGPKETLLVVTSDFLAAGGDDAFRSAHLEEDAVKVHEGVLLRDAMAELLGKAGKETSGLDARFDPKSPRVAFSGKRPVSCGRK